MICVRNSKAFVQSSSLPESFKLKSSSYKSLFHPEKRLEPYLTQNVSEVVFQKSIPARIRQLILNVCNHKGYTVRVYNRLRVWYTVRVYNRLRVLQPHVQRVTRPSTSHFWVNAFGCTVSGSRCRVQGINTSVSA